MTGAIKAGLCLSVQLNSAHAACYGCGKALPSVTCHLLHLKDKCCDQGGALACGMLQVDVEPTPSPALLCSRLRQRLPRRNEETTYAQTQPALALLHGNIGPTS